MTPTSRNQRTYIPITFAMVRGDDLPQDQDSGQTLLPILNSLAVIRHECDRNRCQRAPSEPLKYMYLPSPGDL
jgi:hypothetical protein